MADDPSFKTWLPAQPVAAARLQNMQDRAVTEVKVGPGLTSARKGNSVTIGLVRKPAPIPVAGVFPVKVVKDGGSDGTSTTPATWTYSIYTLTGDGADPPDAGTLLAENQDVAPQRPNGKREFGADYGLCFYNGDTLILWDAGEYESTGEGCVP